jgi:hypothetical protein
MLPALCRRLAENLHNHWSQLSRNLGRVVDRFVAIGVQVEADSLSSRLRLEQEDEPALVVMPQCKPGLHANVGPMAREIDQDDVG